MFEAILDRMAERPPRKIIDEEARLNNEIRMLLVKIKNKSSRSKSVKSLRGGLQSMGARGVLVKDGNIYSRKVIVKASYIQSSDDKAKARLRHHLNYVGRADIDKSPELYGHSDQLITVKDKVNDFETAPHMFNIIISPEDGEKLDLKDFIRDLINTVEKDLRTKLDWVAGNHYDTNDPHVHVLIKGVDDSGKKLLMTRDYISRGLRLRASQIANNKLGLKSYEEVVTSLELKVSSSKKCELDEIIVRNACDNRIKPSLLTAEEINDLPRSLIEKRLAFLEQKGVASKTTDGWQVSPTLHADLRNIDRTSSILKKVSDGLKVDQQACEVISAKSLSERIINGHVIERGYVENHSSKEYLLVKTKEKKLAYVELEKYSEKSSAGVGEFVRIEVTKPFSGPMAADRTIDKVALSKAGIYDAADHAKSLSQSIMLPPGVSASEYTQVHVNRLEILAKRGLVQKLSDGRFAIPTDYLERIAVDAKKSSDIYQPHIKVVRLSASRLKAENLNQGLSR